MTTQEILQTVKDIIAVNFEIKPELLTQDAQLRAHLGMDSLDLVDLTFFVKHHFGIKEGIQAYKNITTIGDLVTFIHETQKATQ